MGDVLRTTMRLVWPPKIEIYSTNCYHKNVWWSSEAWISWSHLYHSTPFTFNFSTKAMRAKGWGFQLPSNISMKHPNDGVVSCCFIHYRLKADSRLAPSQWETSLQSNVVSHWLGANLESALQTADYAFQSLFPSSHSLWSNLLQICIHLLAEATLSSGRLQSHSFLGSMIQVVQKLCLCALHVTWFRHSNR